MRNLHATWIPQVIVNCPDTARIPHQTWHQLCPRMCREGTECKQIVQSTGCRLPQRSPCRCALSSHWEFAQPEVQALCHPCTCLLGKRCTSMCDRHDILEHMNSPRASSWRSAPPCCYRGTAHKLTRLLCFRTSHGRTRCTLWRQRNLKWCRQHIRRMQRAQPRA